MVKTNPNPLLPIFDRVVERAEKAEGRVLEALQDGRWHTAKSLKINERVIRAVAERSGGKIISGQLGYKLTLAASVEEVSHAENWLKAQAQKMITRANQIRALRAGYSGDPQVPS